MEDGDQDARFSPRATPWRVEGVEPPGHWLGIPNDLADDDERLLDWTIRSVDALAVAWGDRWEESFRRPLAELMFGVGARRVVDDGPAFLCWPLPGPITTRVSIDVVASDGLPDWSSDGWWAVPYRSATLGAGVSASRQRTAGEGDDVTQLVEAHYAFVADDVCVLVTVAECPVRFAAFVDGDLERILQGIRVLDAEQRAFVGIPSEAQLAGSSDAWAEGTS